MASHLTVIFIKIMVVPVVCNPWEDAFSYAQMSIQCVECAITEIYLLLVARNILKYISLLVVARNWSLA
jgi:hypothetical protein